MFIMVVWLDWKCVARTIQVPLGGAHSGRGILTGRQDGGIYIGREHSQALGASRTSCTGHGEDGNGDPAAVLRTPRSLQSRASNASLSPLWQESRTVFVMRVSNSYLSTAKSQYLTLLRAMLPFPASIYYL